jgi:hypothetical protein
VARFAGFSRYVGGISVFIVQNSSVLAKRAALAAKGEAKSVMAILAQNFPALVASDSLRFPVEKENSAIEIMGDNAFLKIIENTFQVFFAGDDFFEG